MPAGRPNTPSRLKKLAGTDQPSRMNPNEPVPEVALPMMPDWLSDKAQQYWEQIGDVLLNMKLVSVGDGPALMMLCDVLAEWVEARQFVLENGSTYTTLSENGSEMHRAYPQVAMASDAWRRAMSMLSQFGLTPSSRSKVSALGGEQGVDPFAEMLNEMKG